MNILSFDDFFKQSAIILNSAVSFVIVVMWNRLGMHQDRPNSFLKLTLALLNVNIDL